jgi:hypothetical protein
MKKSQVKSLVLSAAVSGLLTAAAPAFASSTNTNSSPTLSNSSVRMMANAFQSDKHSCKGKNDCKGQGGCKAGDNGCKGKNSCKGKGGCATDGSQNHLA